MGRERIKLTKKEPKIIFLKKISKYDDRLRVLGDPETPKTLCLVYHYTT